MVSYKVVYTKQAIKQIDSNLKNSPLAEKAKKLIDVVKNNPYQTPPPYEKLCNSYKKYYSRRINIKHRLVYEIFEEENTVKIISLWSHYEI